MTTTHDAPSQPTAAAATTFDSLNPRTGDVVGTYPIHDAAHVQAVVGKAKAAAEYWSGLTFEQRAKKLSAFKGVMTRRMAQLTDVVHAETGKPHSDAQLEVALAIEHIAWAAKHAKKVLGKHKVKPGLLMANYGATIEYKPLGVVGVIGPWNYPVFTPMGSITYALAAGNAVVYKPSEYTPGVGAWIVNAFQEAVPEAPVLQLVTGLGATGDALCRAGVNKVAFTGSPGTARKVMHACADNLIPVIIEGGGKDPMLVDEDADIKAAADAAVWGGLSNAGQTCVGVERVYVHEKVYDEFLREVTDLAKTVRAGADPDAKIGPITMPSQLPIIRSHIEDALARGGKAVLGGVDAVGETAVQPTILTDVPEDSIAVTDETFGPTLTIAKVKDMDEAVRLANNTKYGLGSTVFSKKHGLELADRIKSGATAVNSVIAFAAMPALPFGGIGESGFGRIHGADGLREFATPKAVARLRVRTPLLLTTFSRTEKVDQTVAKLITLMHGARAKRMHE
jgi:acyl-CoA reductase-like NAD-dependent aldehyde dehydrogenase